MLNDICTSLKSGEIKQASALQDRTAAYEYTGTFKRGMNQIADETNRILNHQQIAALQIPNTVQSLSCFAWMASYFNLVGDKIPNRDCEIHLEPISIAEIYDEVRFVQMFSFRHALITCVCILVFQIYEIV